MGGGAFAADWPQWRGPARTGVSPETGWLGRWPPVELWRRPVGEGYSSAAVAGGRLYTLGWQDGRDTVWCLDADDGRLLWAHTYPCGTVEYNGPRATPTVAGNEVYIYSHEGELRGFDCASGRVLWQKQVNVGRPRWGLAGSPLVDGGLVILNAGGAGAAVERQAPHRLVWKSEGYAGYASPVGSTWQSRRVVTLFSASGLVGVDPRTGGEVWWFAWQDGFHVQDPVLVGDGLLFSCGTSRFCALLKLAEGELRPTWQTEELQNECATPVVLGECVYGFDGNGALRCLSVRDGTTVWVRDDLGMHDGSLIAADGRLILLGDEGDLAVVRVSARGCEREGRAPVKVCSGAEKEEWATPPALSNGRIYCRSREGTLVCLGVK
ncbi:MAG: PQQ-like beta-propeller repeat protein [Kiritimatiellae bacterium]|nr:PQQ-like beta-propeller repeat protein [Kiritimatiellia bacterium]